MKNEIRVDLLPIGTVCKIRGNKNEYMIIGYFQNVPEEKKTYIYKAVQYPYGLLSLEKCFCFDINDVEKVISKGYNDVRHVVFVNGVNAALNNKEISNILEVSESRVSQLHTKALSKMKVKMGKYMGVLVSG